MVWFSGSGIALLSLSPHTCVKPLPVEAVGKKGECQWQEGTYGLTLSQANSIYC